MNRPVSLYLHIPFCSSRCGYCNFYSTTDLSVTQQYTTALCGAVAAAPLDGREAVTVYFGGGTPSLLGGGLLAVLEAVRDRLPVAAEAEITLEANPGTLTPGLLADLHRGGFNRISFGLQAADDPTLGRLGRGHSAQQGREAVAAARQAGFENISVDLMLATPRQTLAEAERLCSMAVALDVPHISAYLLKIEPDTPFGRSNIQADCPDPDAAADLYLAACGLLEQAGYRHYEISNFCKPGYESRHNTAYWKLDDYLGIGPAAYSLLDGQRFHFPPDLTAFVESRDPWGLVEPDEPEGGAFPTGGWEEYLMLSLRLADGLSLDEAARRYGADIPHLLTRTAPLAANHLLTVTGDRLALTDQGFLLSNSVITYLLE